MEVKSEISRIKTSKATGHDPKSPKLLKDSVEVVAESLTNIFKKSIEKGMFPDDFKIACISPIHKGDSKLECCNYRPISIISVVVKNLKSLSPGNSSDIYNLTICCRTVKLALGKKVRLRTTSLLNNTNKWYI